MDETTGETLPDLPALCREYEARVVALTGEKSRADGGKAFASIEYTTYWKDGWMAAVGIHRPSDENREWYKRSDSQATPRAALEEAWVLFCVAPAPDEEG